MAGLEIEERAKVTVLTRLYWRQLRVFDPDRQAPRTGYRRAPRRIRAAAVLCRSSPCHCLQQYMPAHPGYDTLSGTPP